VKFSTLAGELRFTLRDEHGAKPNAHRRIPRPKVARRGPQAGRFAGVVELDMARAGPVFQPLAQDHRTSYMRREWDIRRQDSTVEGVLTTQM